jgi:hypothetical protein
MGSMNLVKVWFIHISCFSSPWGPVYAVALVGLADACGSEEFVYELRPCGELRQYGWAKYMECIWRLNK